MENSELEKGKKLNLEGIIDYAKGAVVSKTIIKKETGNVSLFVFDKGEGLSEHTAPFDEMVQVIDGKACIIIGGVENNLEKGESIIMPANITHALKAITPFKMILTMVKS